MALCSGSLQQGQRIDTQHWVNTICTSNDVNTCWVKWQSTFLSIMEKKHAPKSTSTSSPQLTRLNKNLLKSMQCRDTLYRRAKKSGNPLHFAKFKHARNKVVSDMWCAKAEYFRRLTLQTVSSFGSLLNKQSSSVPTLNHNGPEYCTDRSQCTEFLR